MTTINHYHTHDQSDSKTQSPPIFNERDQVLSHLVPSHSKLSTTFLPSIDASHSLPHAFHTRHEAIQILTLAEVDIVGQGLVGIDVNES